MAEALAIAVAIATLISGFSASVVLVDQFKAKWKEHRQGKVKLTELEKLQKSLIQAKSTVQSTYDTQYQLHGQRIRTGDDLARYILFALSAQQEILLKNLQSVEFESLNVQPLISKIESTRSAATSCLKELAARAERLDRPMQLTLQMKAALLKNYQGLCPSAAIYREGKAHRSQLGAMSSNKGKFSCHSCGAIITPTKLRILDANATGWVLITLSGLYRAHCHAGRGWTCIWDPKAPSCYSVFQDEKSLLKHMLAIHLANDENDVGVTVDWPADIRCGDLDKCGFMVMVNGVSMQNLAGNLVVPRPRIITTARSTSETSLMSDVSMTTAGVNPRISSLTSEAIGGIALSGIGPRAQEAAEMPCLAIDGIHQMPAGMSSYATQVRHEMPIDGRLELPGNGRFELPA
ncbi:hypothetical protein GJ744_001184 [Endocarpon pusillum]|uniref:Uncharacterized protein n=1 Tax=Endocarpon pusillum TaxID=364733 RepID=A0A8H7DZN7_9EURO|nr:hypothetical protein GJ744_001184 [Endocarpon pusillum]